MQGEKQGNMQAALTLVTAVIGAGFASGQEVMRFLSVFGQWSWLGCILVAGLLAVFSAWSAILAGRLGAYNLATLCQRALGGWAGIAAAWVNGGLLVATAGAMVAAMGELTALALPVHHAYEIGFVLALALSAFLAFRGLSSIAIIGGWLLPICLLLYALLHRIPATEPGVLLSFSSAWRILPLSFAYAAMNAALGCGVLCELAKDKTTKNIMATSAIAGIMLLAMLCVVNAVLLRHAGSLRDASLPVVMLSRSLGAIGYWLCIAVLSLAVLTTLIAMLRSLQRMISVKVSGPLGWVLAVALPFIVGLSGFSNIVSGFYPLLGVATTLLFLAMMLNPAQKRAQKSCARVSEKATGTLKRQFTIPKR